jgi:hypothetical protein
MNAAQIARRTLQLHLMRPSKSGRFSDATDSGKPGQTRMCGEKVSVHLFQKDSPMRWRPSAALIRASLVAFSLAVIAAPAAAQLNALAGEIGGAGSGTNASIAAGCTTYGFPTELGGFFTFNAPFVPQGGIGACNYSGAVSQNSASVGPVSNSQSLAPVLLGNLGYSGYYDGTSSSTSAYKSLSVSAYGNQNGVPGSTLALEQSLAASTFSDTLHLSGLAANSSSAGYAKYDFKVSGSLSAPGLQIANQFGEARAVLDLQQQGGPVYSVFSAGAARGAAGYLFNLGGPVPGWTVGTGSISGSSIFSIELPVDLAQPWDIKVGLLAWTNGSADVSSLTATLDRLSFYDAQHAPIENLALAWTSETNNINAVPEPETYAMILAGLGMLGVIARRRKQKPAA